MTILQSPFQFCRIPCPMLPAYKCTHIFVDTDYVTDVVCSVVCCTCKCTCTHVIMIDVFPSLFPFSYGGNEEFFDR